VTTGDPIFSLIIPASIGQQLAALPSLPATAPKAVDRDEEHFAMFLGFAVAGLLASRDKSGDLFDDPYSVYDDDEKLLQKAAWYANEMLKCLGDWKEVEEFEKKEME
jgi:hypothetical protein